MSDDHHTLDKMSDYYKFTHSSAGMHFTPEYSEENHVKSLFKGLETGPCTTGIQTTDLLLYS